MRRAEPWYAYDARLIATLARQTTTDVGLWLLGAVLIVLVCASPLGVLVEGRDIENPDFLTDIDADGAGAWLLRLATLFVLGGSLGAIVLSFGVAASEARTARIVLAGFFTFFITNSVINSLLGTVPSINPKIIYPVLVLVAIYRYRIEHAFLLWVLKCALAAVILGSLVLSPLVPEATMRSYAPEVRLPFVGFRFWGFANSPNSIGPLALLLLLLMIHQPFRSLAAQAFALAGAVAVLVLAQSQTAWITAAVVLPTYLFYRARTRDGAHQDQHGGYGWMLASIIVIVASTGWMLLGSGAMVADDAMTGRGRIWRVALEMFQANPLFGYGPTAWDAAFRAKVLMPYAFTAHNQLFHSMSTAGLVGVCGWLAYVGALGLTAKRSARSSRGLAPTLLVTFPFIRSFSEASFEFKNILADEFLLHVVVFIVMTASMPTAPRSQAAIRVSDA